MNVPNQLTVLRIFMIPVFVVLALLPMSASVTIGSETLVWTQVIAAVIFAIASITDWLDGKIARAHNLVTNFGKFADPLADKMLVMTAFVILVGQGKASSWMVAVIVCRELAVTGLRLLLVEGGEVMAAAWPGKIKTATQMVAIIFLLIGSTGIVFTIGQIMLVICLIFTIYSGVDYFIKNKDVFKGSM